MLYLSRLTKPWIVYSLCVLSCGAATADEPGRTGYSFFALGLNFIDYEENTARRIDGLLVDIETNTSANVAQQSGAYVAINPDWGFYLISASTLGESRSTENWEIDDVIIRSNRVAFEQQRIGFVFSRRYRSNYHLLFGAQYGNTEFRRFAVDLKPESIAFGLTEAAFDTGTESETVLDLSAVAGIERNTVFTLAEPGWRYQIQAIFGVPVLQTVSNTEISDGKNFTESFNAIQGRLNLAFGYQFSKHIFSALALELSVSQRNAVDREIIDNTGTTEFSENVLVYIFPSVAFYWSF